MSFLNESDPVNTVRVVAFDEYGRLLLGKRPIASKSRGGTFDFFGGKVDKSEPLLQAARREFYEETGISLALGKMSLVHQVQDRDDNKTFIRSYFLYHNQVSAQAVLRLPEHDALGVFEPRTALELIDFEPHRMAIQLAAGVTTVAYAA